MSYSDGEAAILTLIRAMPQFDDKNAVRDKWRVLTSGAAADYVVLRPGETQEAFDYAIGLGRARVLRSWRTVVEVWTRYIDDGDTAVRLQVLTQAVIDHLERYPTLNGLAGVTNARPVGVSNMLERWTEQDGPSWAVWEVYFDWQEEASISQV